MSFKKIRFGTEEIITTTVEDIDGRELSKWKVHKSDFLDVVEILKKTFSLKKKERKYQDKDLSWLP